MFCSRSLPQDFTAHIAALSKAFFWVLIRLFWGVCFRAESQKLPPPVQRGGAGGRRADGALHELLLLALVELLEDLEQHLRVHDRLLVREHVLLRDLRFAGLGLPLQAPSFPPAPDECG